MSGKAQQRNMRVWEIDAVRGHLILWVLIFHLYFTVCAFCINGYYHPFDSAAFAAAVDPLHLFFDFNENGVLHGIFFDKTYTYVSRIGVDVFFIISGISCIFSRDNLKSGLRLVCGAAFVGMFTKLLVLYTGDANQFIRFGVLHCYAACHLIYYFLLEKRSDRTLLMAAIPAFIVGYFLRYHPVSSQFALLYPFGVYEIGAPGRDYWPIFPMLGWFLLGVDLGRRWYPEKRSLFPNSIGKKLTRPLRFLGRYSGVIYCGHMVIYTVVFCGIGYLFRLL